MGRVGYVLVSLFCAVLLAIPSMLFAQEAIVADESLARSFLVMALVSGLSWLPLWPAAAATRIMGYWAGLPAALTAAVLYGLGTAFMIPVTFSEAVLVWLLLWWPGLQAPGWAGRVAAWCLLAGAGALVRWRLPAAWADLLVVILAFNALLTLLYTVLPAHHTPANGREAGRSSPGPRKVS